MNTYVKFAPNVFVAKCTEQHEKGDIIPVTTKYGKDNDSLVFNFLGSKDGFFFYSIVRADGFDHKKWVEQKAEKLKRAAINADIKSESYFKASNKDRDFLSLGEPIKVGHHSEKRHRRIIEQAQNNMSKSVEFSKKSESYDERAEYWEKRAEEINLSMPESLEYFEFKLERAKAYHEELKSGIIKREHAYSLTYAKKEVKDLEDKVKLAKRLWA